MSPLHLPLRTVCSLEPLNSGSAKFVESSLTQSTSDQIQDGGQRPNHSSYWLPEMVNKDEYDGTYSKLAVTLISLKFGRRYIMVLVIIKAENDWQTGGLKWQCIATFSSSCSCAVWTRNLVRHSRSVCIADREAWSPIVPICLRICQKCFQ